MVEFYLLELYHHHYVIISLENIFHTFINNIYIYKELKQPHGAICLPNSRSTVVFVKRFYHDLEAGDFSGIQIHIKSSRSYFLKQQPN